MGLRMYLYALIIVFEIILQSGLLVTLCATLGLIFVTLLVTSVFWLPLTLFWSPCAMLVFLILRFTTVILY